MIVYSDPLFLEHAGPPDHPECPDRATAVVAGLRRSEHVAGWVAAAPGRREDVTRVHDAAYVDALAACAGAGGGALDGDTYVAPRSFAVALAAAGTVVEATDRALAAAPGDPARRAFAVVRPPGHHALGARGMGFCLFNNVAVAAARARAVHGVDRVAIVDFDVHHGNGTQDLFWRDGTVLYVSLHRYPYYPGTGAADETGEGPGLGATANFPLPGSTRPQRYRAVFREAMTRAVLPFKPGLVLASAGFDAFRGDPVGGLGLDADDFAFVGEELARVAGACGGRLVSVLEGGYALLALPDLVAAYADGVAAGAGG